MTHHDLQVRRADRAWAAAMDCPDRARASELLRLACMAAEDENHPLESIIDAVALDLAASGYVVPMRLPGAPGDWDSDDVARIAVGALVDIALRTVQPVPQRFHLVRDEDPSGISGTGVVADGVAWPDGTVALRWRAVHGEHADRGVRPTLAVHDSVSSVQALHGHHGATRIDWIDQTVNRWFPPRDPS